ncbi:sigma-70 family RNA polymerase sigma factor [Bordetella holmesii]|uniref:Sigma-70, region 4 n=4 Tax=Bordetella holmesii TaxID=35814 RepID=A0A158M613_9BORD|nr:sigma-70 family RNA polymerase sigma factor [Bordetella holmesii]AHV91280.1 putative RNA polymerase sigma factor fecI [Bordetella holmesii ATCC 51541]AIT28524.1 putative RNA polymerase sigma factor fecI [Bordetella holmesii 44057]EWM41310.1 putative RNA polymerase sigma factor fecI [Bordetella holmesii 35009]EWM43406.1 putative RNA polymerase sigma factor fecI [Bordetella holmesii 41130]EWM45205.1 putative RNA polymerase sigma factor fecI [Bordetella holmesii 70147]
MPTAEFPAQHDLHTLYSDHHSWLFRWLRKKLGNSFDAADVTQDTFVNVITAGSMGSIREPRAFLVTVARRLVAHRHRRQVLETSYLEILASLPQEIAPSPEAQLLALEALQELDRVLDGLPPKAKEAFLLVHLEELSYAEVANRLGVSASSVKQYLVRANRQCLFALSA